MTSLRHIAVTVEQTGRNDYTWVLTESIDGRSAVLKKGQPRNNYMDALDAGHEELAQLLAQPETHDAV
jgi:hypothetical protein